jgi:hypothetical protein
MGMVIEGPSAAAVGWIPFAWPWKRMPAGFREYAESPIEGMRRFGVWAAFKGLFWTGNRPPPDSFEGIEGLAGWLDRQDFRMALCLYDVRLWCDDHGRPYDVTCKCLPVDLSIGFTPIWLLVTTLHADGVDDRADPERDITAGGGEIRQTVWARLGPRMDQINHALTGHWAPYALMKVVYRIDPNLEIRVDFAGSAIPSQWHYLDWKRAGAYDMTAAQKREVRRFMEAGQEVLAPALHRCTLLGKGRRVTIP